MSPQPVPDSKLNREAVAANLRGCLDTLIATAHLQLTYRIETPPAGPDLEAPELVADFEGPDQEGFLATTSTVHTLPSSSARRTLIRDCR